METPDLETMLMYFNEVALLDADYEKHYFWKVGPRQYRDLIVSEDSFIYSFKSPAGNHSNGTIWGMDLQVWRDFDGVVLEITEEYRQQIEMRKKIDTFFDWENWR